MFFENVEHHFKLGFDEVYRDLSEMGYRVEAGIFSAAEVGPPHLRKRLFILGQLADARYDEPQGWQQCENPGSGPQAGDETRPEPAPRRREMACSDGGKEMADAQGLLTGNFALSLEDPANFANMLATRYLTGVPIEELNTYLQSLEDVTPAQAQAAAANYIDSDHPIIVVIGDASQLKPQLEQIAPVMVVDNNGNMITGPVASLQP